MNDLNKLSILLIEDDEDDYLITKRHINNIPDKSITLDWVSSFDAAKEALATSQHDICLIDYRLGEHTGLELLQHAKEVKYRTPTIILTGEADHKTDIKATEAGASDFLVKTELNSRQLERTFRYTIKMKQVMDGLRKARDHLEAEVAIRKQTEVDLVTAIDAREAAIRAKSEFLSNMSHEMRTPMHAILSYAELAKTDMDSLSREDLAQYFSHIASSGERLMELITTLLNLSELDSGHKGFDMQEADLIEIVQAIASDHASQHPDKPLTLSIDADEEHHTAQFDIIQIMQVISGLLQNATSYAPESQSLLLSLTPAKLKNHTGDTIAALTFSLSDQGVGIPEDELESIFNTFEQSTKTKTGAGGTGLGLSICKKVIEGHHGKIWAANNAQGGATFSFTIPLTQPAANEKPYFSCDRSLTAP